MSEVWKKIVENELNWIELLFLNATGNTIRYSSFEISTYLKILLYI